MKKIVTHSGQFHCDDVFAVATLELYLEKTDTKYTVIRTRNEDEFVTADFLIDVGGEYDPSRNRFDHHQKEGAGIRDNGIPYASFGLVWKTFAPLLCSDLRVVEKVEKKLVMPIDAGDSGMLLYSPKIENIYEYSIAQAIAAFVPTWKENDQSPTDIFPTVVAFAKQIIQREIKKAEDKIVAEQEVLRVYQDAIDKTIIEFPMHYPWKETLSKYEEPLYIISPREDKKYQVQAVPKGNPLEMKYRKYFPREWGGLRSEELAKITGVSDALFCHKDCFLVVAGSLLGARTLAQLAVNA